jgi:hypothetical protein
MSERLEQREVERLLEQLPVSRVPDGLWDRVQTALGRPEAARPVSLMRRRVRPWLAAAAVLIATVAGSYVGALRSYAAPKTWAVRALAGTPLVAGAPLAGADGLTEGSWLVTDSASRAELIVGRIGVAEIGPSSRVRLDRGGLTEHRLTLQRGSLHAVIEAPPRLFFVETPAALATDLGCEYTLHVDSAGTSRIHVTAGWVELRQGREVSLVPAGLVAEVEVGARPGTPYPADFPAEARAALHRLDARSARSGDLDMVMSALHHPTEFITLRQQSAITLWHLLQRVSPEARPLVYERLAALSAPPADVTREGILERDRRMLERWRRDLSPMWSEQAQSWVTRLARRLWNWTIG